MIRRRERKFDNYLRLDRKLSVKVSNTVANAHRFFLELREIIKIVFNLAKLQFYHFLFQKSSSRD